MEPISIKLPLFSHGLNPFSYQNEEKYYTNVCFCHILFIFLTLLLNLLDMDVYFEPNSACNLQPACLDIQILNYLDFGITNVSIKINVLSKLQ